MTKANEIQGGRQNEAFSPDPYLSGIAVAAGVKGQQDAGVIAGVRHFLLYEQETNRMYVPNSSYYRFSSRSWSTL